MAEVSGDLISLRTAMRASVALAQLRLVALTGSAVNEIKYATAGGTDAIGRTDDPVTSDDITNGNTLVTVSHLKDGDVITCISSEALSTIDLRVKVAANGTIAAIDTNATPVAQNIIGRTLETCAASDTQVRVRIHFEVITQ